MRLSISNEQTVNDVQENFNKYFPFLKLEFYQLQAESPALTFKKHLTQSTPLRAAGLKQKAGILEIHKDMKVNELEKQFLNRFGLNVQVCRKSGTIWLETTMTDNWTLQKQNEHGQEVSMTARVSHNIIDREDRD
jgi:hypothetical protein